MVGEIALPAEPLSGRSIPAGPLPLPGGPPASAGLANSSLEEVDTDIFRFFRPGRFQIIQEKSGRSTHRRELVRVRLRGDLISWICQRLPEQPWLLEDLVEAAARGLDRDGRRGAMKFRRFSTSSWTSDSCNSSRPGRAMTPGWKNGCSQSWQLAARGGARAGGGKPRPAAGGGKGLRHQP